MKRFILFLVIICLPAALLADDDSTEVYTLPDSSLSGTICLESVNDSLFEIFIDDVSIGLIDNQTVITIMTTMNEISIDSTHSTSDVFWVRTDCHGLNSYISSQLSNLEVRVYFDPVQEGALKKLSIFADK